MSDDVAPAELRELLDKSQIHDVLMRYCRGVDRVDVEILHSVFHDDAQVDFGGGDMPAANLLKGIESNRGASAGNMHFVGNELIEVSGDSAFSEIYFISFATTDRDGTPFTRSRGGRYLDRFTRRGGQWRIEHRTLVDEWSRYDAVTEPGVASPGHRGVQSFDDLVYALKG